MEFFGAMVFAFARRSGWVSDRAGRLEYSYFTT